MKNPKISFRVLKKSSPTKFLSIFRFDAHAGCFIDSKLAVFIITLNTNTNVR